MATTASGTSSGGAAAPQLGHPGESGPAIIGTG